MRARDAFPSKYLQSSDAKATSIVATISHMAQDLVGRGKIRRRSRFCTSKIKNRWC
jgi:hypothetical protein